jgi:hypothetical protein
MKGKIQLRIPTPCSENWENMRPEEKGRYCGTCSKTVVDFSMMSDREILAHLARVGQHVCGRMAVDQLNRTMALQPDAAKLRQRWWKWLLAGLLISSEAKAQRLAAKPTTHQIIKPVLAGVTMGDTIVVAKDSIKVQELPAVEVKGYLTTRALAGTVGMVSTVSGRQIESSTSSIRWIKDTLTTIGLLPKKEWNIYPNPARRGSPVMLTWRVVQAGVYEVGLFNTQGALIQHRVLQVDNKDQVDLLDIPSSLAAGVYLLRATPVGSGKPVTQKLVVL